MFGKLKQRPDVSTWQEKLIDSPSIQEAEVVQGLQDIQWVNKHLKGSGLILTEVLPYLQMSDHTLRILDIGTGSADIPIALVKQARSLRRNIHITALDINPTAVDLAKEMTKTYPEIDIVQGDALNLTYQNHHFDLTISSMFLHRLHKNEAVKLLQEMARISKQAFIVSDLERHFVPYLSIRLIGCLTGKGRVFRNDAPIAIKQGFNRSDLEELEKLSGLYNLQIKHRSPYRWVISWHNQYYGI